MLLWIKTFIVSIALVTTSGKIIIPSHHEINHPLDIELSDVQVLFGGDIPPEGIKGYVMSAIPEDACQKIDLPPKNGTSFALIKKGNCNYDTKIRNAQNSNFSLAIVYNVKSNIILPFNGNNVTDIFIPMIFVGENTGCMLKKYIDHHHSFYVTVLKNQYSFEMNWNLLLPFIIFAVIIPVYFFAILGFMTAKWIKNSRRTYTESPAATNTFPISLFFRGCPHDTCVICLDDYVEGDELQVMPCNHAYHSECIQLWLLQKKSVCPICNRQVIHNNEASQLVGTVPYVHRFNEPNDRTPLVAYRF